MATERGSIWEERSGIYIPTFVWPENDDGD